MVFSRRRKPVWLWGYVIISCINNLRLSCPLTDWVILLDQTNGSSIVSKRSVERLYLPEPHFFRYFVKKPQRRSPLINRGYWLRMYAIEHSVRQFLTRSPERPKLVLNFGCG